MELLKNNEVAIVTGASRGIGRATALSLAREGARVVVNFIESQELAEAIVGEIADCGGEAIAVQGDVASSDDMNQLADTTLARFGAIDILVNNAGILLRPNDWQNITDDVWQRTLDVNLKGMLNCIKAVAPYMLKHSRGKIINVSSTYGIFGSANMVAYVVAKSGVLSLTRSFAKELAPHINVNAVAPGHILTDLTPKTQGFVERISEATPAGRLGRPEEVADLITFLASDHADYITGQVIAIDGGHILR